MKKTLRYVVPLIFSLVLATGAASAADPQLALQPAPQPVEIAATCEAPSSASEAPPVAIPAIDLFTAEPQPVAICPLIGCLNGHCRRDRDCTAAPGGVCNLFCPTQGCCAYPSP